jgi:predicted LPLAT superfamily acyltransferase
VWGLNTGSALLTSRCSLQVVINALMYTANARHFRSLLEQVNAQSFVRVVDISSLDPWMVLDLRTRLAQGEVVALLGDRAPESSVRRAIEVPFLGGIARFPEGPWILASLLEVPVYTVFSMREAGGRYYVEFSELANQIALPRESRGAALRGYISEFATRLGATVQRYPYQWFNFYPFWDDERRNEDPISVPRFPGRGENALQPRTHRSLAHLGRRGKTTRSRRLA